VIYINRELLILTIGDLLNINDIMVFSGSDIPPPKKTKKKRKNKKDDTPAVKYKVNADFLLKYFKLKRKLKKDDYIVFSSKKTILGTKIKSNDKVIEVIMVNAHEAASVKFISVTCRFVVERELKETSKIYMSLDDSRRVPLIVERKYMEDDSFYEHRMNIIEQFL